MRSNTSNRNHEDINKEPWYPDDGEAQGTEQIIAEVHQRKATPLRTAIAGKVNGWTWYSPDSATEQPGITWIELQTALLLDDTIIALLIKDMDNKGWPSMNQEKS